MKKRSYLTSSSPKGYRKEFIGQLMVNVTKITEGRDRKGYITISHALTDNFPTLTIPLDKLNSMRQIIIQRQSPDITETKFNDGEKML